MSALRSAVSVAGLYDPDAEDGSEDGDNEGTFKKAIRLTARIATITAAIHRLRNGQEPVEPNPELGFAANFMFMLNGREPTADETKAMDLILILHAEHGFNASTFSARVICATLPDLYSAITGAIGALKGKLHGGA
ncbi:citrate synthase, partial [bacterium]|nr:citrate synthase [bacterium]